MQAPLLCVLFYVRHHWQYVQDLMSPPSAGNVFGMTLRYLRSSPALQATYYTSIVVLHIASLRTYFHAFAIPVVSCMLYAALFFQACSDICSILRLCREVFEVTQTQTGVMLAYWSHLGMLDVKSQTLHSNLSRHPRTQLQHLHIKTHGFQWF